jgi:kynurenine 3-monooxygenase
VHTAPWHLGEQCVLIGDAAHAMVPFHGQGMNCAFEDCRILDALLADGLPQPFARFSAQRKPDADAIVQMALENHAEMSDSVRSPRFQLQRELALQLQRRHPQRFVPRYAMVTFRDDIGYATALQRGRVQQQLLDEMTQPAEDCGLPAAASLDWAHWDAQVVARLAPL